MACLTGFELINSDILLSAQQLMCYWRSNGQENIYMDMFGNCLVF